MQELLNMKCLDEVKVVWGIMNKRLYTEPRFCGKIFPFIILFKSYEWGDALNKSINFILIAVALAMGVGTLVLNVLNEMDVNASIIMLSISVICLAMVKLQQR